MKLYDELRAAIIEAVPELSVSDFDFQPTPENQPGDIGLVCFAFSKILHQSPHAIAQNLTGLNYPSHVTHAEAVGSYINFSLDRSAFATELIREVFEKGSSFGSDGSGSGRHILLEHTSINPNASPHIGRARNGLLGDSLARLFRFEGFDVNVHYYVNDMGKQIALLVLETEGMNDLLFHDILDLYVRANQRAKDDPEFEKRGFELLMRMEQGDAEIREKFRKIVSICLKGQLEVLGRLGLSYDTFDHESVFLADPRMTEVMNMLVEKGALFTDDQGRKVADLKKLGYPLEEGRYIVLLRANGSSMYMYRDIAYTLEKIERAGDLNLVILGEDHKMYFEQLTTIIRAMGKTLPEVIHYSYILLREGKMSTRQGNVVLLEDFLDETIRRAREKVDAQWPELPEPERNEIAGMIGIGAVRFTILSVRPNRNVIFDWDTALSFNGDSGPYIQYSGTRISSILRKYGSIPVKVEKPVRISAPAEWSLLIRLAATGDDISAAIETRNPAIIANSALDIARRFSIFYNECPVLSAEDPEIRESRILICTATRQALTNLLGLIGIEAPERM
ncbi:MAG: arginine--tRNA ligase [Candidatus Latescibacterota bacterium]